MTVPICSVGQSSWAIASVYRRSSSAHTKTLQAKAIFGKTFFAEFGHIDLSPVQCWGTLRGRHTGIKGIELLARFLFLFVLISTSACGPEAPERSDERVYRHALDGVPGNIDPVRAGTVYASAVVVNAYDTLYRYRYLARPYELAPNLAAELPEVSDDGLTHTITLREGVHFIDDPAFPDGRGREVVASDVVYSLKRHFDPDTGSRGAWLWRDRIVGLDAWGEAGADYDAEVEGLRPLDRHTLQIRLDRPFPQLAHTLASAMAAVVPREAVEHYGPELGSHAVGSGPFVLESIDETRALMRRNPGFDRGRIDLAEEGFDPDSRRHVELGLDRLADRPYPMIDRLELAFISEPGARWTSFTGAAVDSVMVPPEQAGRVLESTNPPRFGDDIAARYRHHAAPESGFVFFGFNMDNPAIGHHDDPDQARRNRKLRCAIRDAFDWSAYNETFHHGLGQVFPGVIPPGLASFDPEADTAPVEHAPQRARERLADAGWQTGELPDLVFGLEGSVHQRQMFEQFRARMREAGLPESMFKPRGFASFGDFSRALARRELDVFMLGWTLAYPDAQYSLQLFHGPNAAPGANSFNYANPDFDQRFERASTMPEGPERRALYRELEAMVIDDCVVLSGLARTRLFLWQPEVTMLPDREILGGYFLRFVDVDPPRPSD